MDKMLATQLSTIDDTNGLPALTTLLYKVCGGDSDKFEEACRLVTLFMEKAQENK